MYFHERLTRELQTLYILQSLQPVVLVKYLLDNYFRSAVAIYVLI